MEKTWVSLSQAINIYDILFKEEGITQDQAINILRSIGLELINSADTLWGDCNDGLSDNVYIKDQKLFLLAVLKYNL